jgi:hypothetical protein
MGDRTTNKGTCVRVQPKQVADATRFVRRVRDDGVRSLPPDVQQAMDRMGVDCDCVSDVVRVALELFFEKVGQHG